MFRRIFPVSRIAWPMTSRLRPATFDLTDALAVRLSAGR